MSTFSTSAPLELEELPEELLEDEELELEEELEDDELDELLLDEDEDELDEELEEDELEELLLEEDDPPSTVNVAVLLAIAPAVLVSVTV
jgi:hypothetical protein